MTEQANWSLTVTESATSTSDLARAADAGSPLWVHSQRFNRLLVVAVMVVTGLRKGQYVLHAILLRPEITKKWFGFSLLRHLAVR